MASEPTDGETASPREDLDAWLDERAAELGLDREEFVERLLSAYRAAVTDLDDADADAASLGARLDRLRREHREYIDDLRKRVLQVKETAEAKAPIDHHHEEFDRLDDLDGQVSVLADRVEALSETTERLVDREVVTADELADLEGKLTRVARAVVELRNAEGEAATEAAADERLRDLRRTAAREGYERATCGACGETLRVGLLPEAACPACGAPFHDIEGGGLFRKSTLRGPEGNDG